MDPLVDDAQRRITVGQLRQNPAQMIHDVRLGHEYVLTDRGVPTALISPIPSTAWVSTDTVHAFLNAPTDPEWLSDLRAMRTDTTMDDPWAAP